MSGCRICLNRFSLDCPIPGKDYVKFCIEYRYLNLPSYIKYKSDILMSDIEYDYREDVIEELLKCNKEIKLVSYTNIYNDSFEITATYMSLRIVLYFNYNETYFEILQIEQQGER
jgi:hypothetical protein